MPPKSRKRRGPTASNTTLKEPKVEKTSAEVFTVPPTQSKKKKKEGQLTGKQVKQYFEEGFLLLPNFFNSEELEPVRKSVQDEVERIAQNLYAAGKIKEKHEDSDLFHRLTLLEKDFPGASVLLHKSEVLPQSFKDLWSNERILNIMEQLVGPEVAGHPIWNLRCKTPFNEMADVPWHQDNAYLDESGVHTMIPTVWIPLLDVNTHNGCLQIARGGHRKGVTATHTCCAGGTWYVQVSEEEMENKLGIDFSKDIVTCDFEYGGMLLFNNAIPHRSLENKSDIIRWSLDLRYQSPDKPSAFWGLKEHVLLRTQKDKNFKINWEDFEKVDRSDVQVKAALSSQSVKDEFDTTVSGPWMNRWNVVHHNKHTANLTENADTWTKA